MTVPASQRVLKMTSWAFKFASVCAILFFGNSLAGQESKTDDGFKSIFDGKSLEGWSGDKKHWSVEDGAIVGETTPEKKLSRNTFLILKGDPVGDFELRLKFRISGKNANSGIQFRSTDLGEHVVKGYQADIDITGRFIGILYEERGRGILAQRGEKVVRDEDGKKKKTGTTLDEKEFKEKVKMDQWNEYVVIAKGNHIVQKINGLTTVDFTDNEKNKAKPEGIIALQCHVGPPMKIEFKDIQLKRFKK